MNNLWFAGNSSKPFNNPPSESRGVRAVHKLDISKTEGREMSNFMAGFD